MTNPYRQEPQLEMSKSPASRGLVLELWAAVLWPVALHAVALFQDTRGAPALMILSAALAGALSLKGPLGKSRWLLALRAVMGGVALYLLGGAVLSLAGYAPKIGFGLWNWSILGVLSHLAIAARSREAEFRTVSFFGFAGAGMLALASALSAIAMLTAANLPPPDILWIIPLSLMVAGSYLSWLIATVNLLNFAHVRSKRSLVIDTIPMRKLARVTSYESGSCLLELGNEVFAYRTEDDCNAALARFSGAAA